MATADIMHATDLSASAQDVWRRFSDFTTYADWNVNHVAFPDGPPTLAAGVSYREQLQVRNAPGEVSWTVSELEDNHRLVLDGKGPMGIKLQQTFTVTPTDGGSRLSASLRLSSIALKPMIKAVSGEVDRTLAESLQRFAALVTA